MTELALSVLFFLGLFIIQPLTAGMPTKITAIVTLAYMVGFGVVAGLISRLF